MQNNFWFFTKIFLTLLLVIVGGECWGTFRHDSIVINGQRFTLVQNISSQYKYSRSIGIIGKDFVELLSDNHHNGYFDTKEIIRKNWRFRFFNGSKGVFHFLTIQHREQKGFRTIYFKLIAKEDRYKPYRQTFVPYATVRSDESSCTGLPGSVGEWNSFIKDLTEEDLANQIQTNTYFLNQSCKTGVYESELPQLSAGIAKVFNSAKDSSNKKFVNCLYDKGFTTLADKLELKFLELMKHLSENRISCSNIDTYNADGLYDSGTDMIYFNNPFKEKESPDVSASDYYANIFFHEALHMTEYPKDEAMVHALQNCCGTIPTDGGSCDYAKTKILGGDRLETFVAGMYDSKLPGWDEMWTTMRGWLPDDQSEAMMKDLVEDYATAFQKASESDLCYQKNYYESSDWTTKDACNKKIGETIKSVNESFFGTDKCKKYAARNDYTEAGTFCQNYLGTYQDYLNYYINNCHSTNTKSQTVWYSLMIENAVATTSGTKTFTQGCSTEVNFSEILGISANSPTEYALEQVGTEEHQVVVNPHSAEGVAATTTKAISAGASRSAPQSTSSTLSDAQPKADDTSSMSSSSISRVPINLGSDYNNAKELVLNEKTTADSVTTKGQSLFTRAKESLISKAYATTDSPSTKTYKPSDFTRSSRNIASVSSTQSDAASPSSPSYKASSPVSRASNNSARSSISRSSGGSSSNRSIVSNSYNQSSDSSSGTGDSVKNASDSATKNLPAVSVDSGLPQAVKTPDEASVSPSNLKSAKAIQSKSATRGRRRASSELPETGQRFTAVNNSGTGSQERNQGPSSTNVNAHNATSSGPIATKQLFKSKDDLIRTIRRGHKYNQKFFSYEPYLLSLIKYNVQIVEPSIGYLGAEHPKTTVTFKGDKAIIVEHK